jgi:hypothetical protein
MRANPQSMPESDFGRRIDALHAADEVVDPAEFLQLLDARPQISIPEARRLWEIAVTQSTLADLQVASGDDSPQILMWQEMWAAAVRAMRPTLASAFGTPEAEKTLMNYWEQTRALKAIGVFIPLVRRLEAALARQRNVIAFHWNDDENAYRQSSVELSRKLGGANISDEERKRIAAELGDRIDRYQEAILPKLAALTSGVDEAFARCERLVPMFSATDYAEVHRWHELTHQLITARVRDVSRVLTSLDFDSYLSTESLAGNVVTKIDDATETVVLNEGATARAKQFLQESVVLLEQSAHVEQELDEDERNELTRRLIGEVQPTAPAVDSSPSPQPTPALSRRHPIENKPWFRLAKVVWWGFATLGVTSAAFRADTLPEFLGYTLLIAVALVVVRKATYYVMLGRTTLYEPAGTGFIDLDMFEEEVSARSDGSEDETLKKAVAGMRARYGSRAPVSVVRAVVDRELSNVRSEKKRILSEADRDGKTISVDSLRATLNASQDEKSEAERDENTLFFDRYLLRLEVKYGPEIPVSVVDEEADALGSHAS